jgi:phosphoribosylamine--glycine ligase
MTQPHVLLVGGGAREHAIGQALVDGDARLSVVMSNENPGLMELADDVELGSEENPSTVVDHARATGASLAISGPEGPIASGVTDALADAGVTAVSPSQAAGRIETDKAWMRTLMAKHDVPGRVRHRHFEHAQGLRSYVEDLGEVAVKPVGLTGGKGVKVTGEHLDGTDEAVDYASEVLTTGYGGGQVVVEEKLEGEEFTLQCFTDGSTVVPTPPVQDHKRAFEGDEGPNTGGMGSYSGADGLPFLPREDHEAAVEIVEAIVDALDDEGAPYVGTIYGQFMLTSEGPKVVEVNARFGDPEAMNTLPVLETPFPDVVEAMAEGRLDALDVEFADKATVCKYVVPAGYGGPDPEDGIFLGVDEDAIRDTGASLYYASCDAADGGVTTTTSRTLAVVGVADTIDDANEQAEAALDHVDGDDVRIRHDIGTAELVDQRVDHVRELGRAP